MRNRIVFAAASALAGLTLGVSAAAAAVTYQFTESAGALNATSGALGGLGAPQVPFTFDFTVANVLAASTHYTFGAAGALGAGSAGVSGDVLDFSFTDGSPLSAFSLADYPAVHEGFRGGPAASDIVQIGVTTDAAGAISLFDVLIIGRSTVKPTDILHLQLQHDTPSGGVAIVLAAYDYGSPTGSYRFVDGDLHCSFACGGGFTQADGGAAGASGAAGAVPEPASWALMIVGFGGIGATLRRRRASPLASGIN